jgi:hypothetical protein
VALFAAQGFEVAPVPAGETRAPQRDLPFAIVGSLVAASLLYVSCRPCSWRRARTSSRSSDTPLVDAARSVAPALAFLVVAGGLVSTLGFVSGSALGTPRYLFAAAADRHLPARARRGAPALRLAARRDRRHRRDRDRARRRVRLPLADRHLERRGRGAVPRHLRGGPVLRRRGVPGGACRADRSLPALGARVSLWVFTEASREELVWAAAALAIGSRCSRCAAGAS